MGGQGGACAALAYQVHMRVVVRLVHRALPRVTGMVHLWQEDEVPGKARAGGRREQAQAEELVAVALERRTGERFREDVGDVVLRADLAKGDHPAGDGAADHSLAGRHPASLLRDALGGDAVQDGGRICPT